MSRRRYEAETDGVPDSLFGLLQACYRESMRAARIIAAALISICLVAAAKADAQVSIGVTLGYQVLALVENQARGDID